MPERVDPKPNTTRRLRLKGYDYATSGYYFITICQRDRRHLFSQIRGGIIMPSPQGEMITDVSREISHRYRNASVDSFVVMPNHVHFLLGMNLDEKTETPTSLVKVVEWWKSQTTSRYGWGVKKKGWPRYRDSLWQEGYHDRIVRDQRELEFIRYYIEQNPVRWEEDSFFDEE